MRPKISKSSDTFLKIEENPELIKYKKLLNIYNNINSLEFDELLLFTFENQCQSYFEDILKKYDNIYDKKSYKEILLDNSLDYFKKSQDYLYNHKTHFNKILKFISIAYIKLYILYYVELNYYYNNVCDFDPINKALDDENKSDFLIRNVRNIYLFRVYLRKFENFDMFLNFKYKSYKFPIFKELLDKLEDKNNNNNQYIFTESFICYNNFEEFKKNEINISINNKNFEFNFDLINNNFDIFYCALVNKVLSYLYHNNQKKYIDKLKIIYEKTKDEVHFEPEGNILYQKLMNYEIYQRDIVQKISDKPLTQEEFEILLYSFRFIFNIQTSNKNGFYKNILKKNSFQYINNNFIPGAFPAINEFIKSYNTLEELFTRIENIGYYICKDCGFLYFVQNCTLPMVQDHCPNGHIIGGQNHECYKRDIRVFPNAQVRDNAYKNDSLVPVTLEEFKNNYVDRLMPQRGKGIIQGYRNIDYIQKKYLTNLNVITYRILNFILYSFILFSYILNNIKQKEVQTYLVENLFPHTLFGVIKEGWRLLNESLREIGIESAKIFFNMTFAKIIELMNNLDNVVTLEKLERFEKEINDFILGQIQHNKVKEINEEYQRLNRELLNLNPNNIKEVIIDAYDPSFYSKEIYPDIKYFCVPNINNLDTFAHIFNSSNENKKKYSLISLLVNKDSEFTRNIINMKNLVNINKLSNLLLKIYSYKITREDAKKNKFKKEISFIKENFNKINNMKISEKKFNEEYIVPFINSWEQIKHEAVQYKCRILRDIEQGEKPLDIKVDNSLCYYLVDDGDKDGGMFLAAAYENFIKWQNQFIDDIIAKNNFGGILNSYISQIGMQINVQEAIESDIIKINDDVYNTLNNLINSCSIRNIFNINEQKIYYKNYNDIKYNYDLIEEELGKLILPGIKKFTPDKIKFIRRKKLY